MSKQWSLYISNSWEILINHDLSMDHAKAVMTKVSWHFTSILIIQQKKFQFSGRDLLMNVKGHTLPI